MAKVILQYTDVPASRTLAEIQTFVQDCGASAFMVQYAHGRPSGVAFGLPANGRVYPIVLPARSEAVFQLLQQQRPPDRRERSADIDRERAERTAWRQVLLWLKAQHAMLQTGMVEPLEVFLPYVRMPDGSTYYQHLSANRFKALPAPEAGGCHER